MDLKKICEAYIWPEPSTAGQQCELQNIVVPDKIHSKVPEIQVQKVPVTVCGGWWPIGV